MDDCSEQEGQGVTRTRRNKLQGKRKGSTTQSSSNEVDNKRSKPSQPRRSSSTSKPPTTVNCTYNLRSRSSSASPRTSNSDCTILSSKHLSQEKQEANRKPVTVPSFAATFTKSKQTQPSLSAIGNLVTSHSSTPHLSSSSSSAIGNSSSTSKSSSRGRRAASASSLTDKTAATNQSTSQTTCAPSRSWRRSDPPEPSTGLRRSQRLKETTGSCASNSRRGPQGKKQSWTRRQSPSMSADNAPQDPGSSDAAHGSVEDSIPSASGEASRSEVEGPGSFEDMELKDGELSRLQALLEARGVPSHLIGSLGPRMHQLLHRTISSSSGGKVQQMLTGIQSSDEGQQLQSVIEMCQFLVMGNEESLVGFPVKQVVPALVNLLSMEHNFDMMNHGCRALTYLMEALPRSTAVVVEAVPVFIEKLQVIQCMDVAEQALTALAMLSRRHGKAILQAGGMSACLLYLDFFSISAQRSALSVAANCCHSIGLGDFHLVADSIPILSGRLQHQDKKSVESCCVAFARLVDSFHTNEKHLEELAAHGLLNNLQQLLMMAPPVISTSTFVMVVRMLAVLCSNSPAIAVQLLRQNVSDTILYLLLGTTEPEEIENAELLSRSPQEFFEITCFISELLPKLPSNGIFSVDALLCKPQQKSEQGLWQWRDDRGLWHTYSWIDSKIIEAAYQSGEDELTLTTLGRTYTVDFNSMQQTNEDTGTSRQIQRCPGGSETSTAPSKTDEAKAPRSDERLVVLCEEAELASSYTCGMFSALYKIFSSSVGPAVRHKCVNAILRVLCHAPPDLLGVVLKRHPISSLIGGMLQSTDLRVITNALQMAEIVMQKLPDVFHVSFRREGVMHRVRDLANGLLANKPSVSDKNCSSECLANSSENESPGQRATENTSSLPVTRRLGDVLRRKRYSKRPGRGKASSFPSTSEVQVEVNRQQIGGPSSKTMLHESRAAFLASQSSTRLNSRSALLSERPAKMEASVGSTVSENRDKIMNWIKDQASKFCAEYFDQQKGDSHPALSVLRQLKSASEELALDKQKFTSALKEVSNVLTNEDNSACAFEILHSGLVPNLLRYLTSTEGSDTLPQEKRLRIFFHVFMGLPETNSTEDLKIVSEPETASMTALIQKLHLCINQLEQLPVKVHDTPGGAVGARGSQALRFFSSHQIKCLLQRHPDCEGLRQWKRGPVKIDPLALVQAIERYLVVRGYGKKRENPDDDGSEDDGSDDDIDESLATELQGQNNSRHQLEILLGDHLLPYNMTVYQAIKQFAQGDEDKDFDDDHGGILGRPSIWVSTHTIWFRPLSQNQREQQTVNSSKPKSGATSTGSRLSRKTWKEDDSEVSLSQLLSDCEPQNFTTCDPSIEVISLMKALHVLNLHWTTLYEGQSRRAFLSSNEFINNKLAAKITRQLQDPITVITGNFPAWVEELPRKCPFLFPFECRQQLFYCTAMDRDRALSKLQETLPELMNTDASDRVAPRFDRKKHTVSRVGLLDQAEKLIGDLGSSQSVLEIQYEGEVGTGLGPTLEFYALISQEFQRADLEMWRGERMLPPGRTGFGDDVSYVYSPSGLYPAPMSRIAKVASVTKLCSKFQFLGKFLARAIMDFRILDIPFCQILYKWLLNQEGTLDLGDLAAVDSVLAQSLTQLQQVVQKKRQLEQDSSHTADSRQLAVESLTLDGTPIEDLGLSFALPGHPDIELKRGGKDMTVTIHDLEEYVKLVVQWTLVTGVRRQMDALREGFNSVLPLSNLTSFSYTEMELVLCGNVAEKWDIKCLVESCRPDHGYTHDSRAVKILFEILSCYTQEEQRLFLQFVTGSPRLPVGGLRSLNPPLTIVRKSFEPPLCADNYLPSVMTCVNYLKLPDYSSKEIMASKLKLAALEGQRSFHLS
ncbi:E3 ubiquitin-protein ligase TRIP12-like isoform X1 [Orbicella faveolata]|uniref:E3 ubiquitin-protein ligase TRIP12-like isoform X1 n=1 Tax=Orbicella faveolata TaxID=48498 RepID=UPI0009E18CE2|nr:E3 ubiquitin-protein ligase TRIP12-like isoform X1 [Orbicella faveolata]